MNAELLAARHFGPHVLSLPPSPRTGSTLPRALCVVTPPHLAPSTSTPFPSQLPRVLSPSRLSGSVKRNLQLRVPIGSSCCGCHLSALPPPIANSASTPWDRRAALTGSVPFFPTTSHNHHSRARVITLSNIPGAIRLTSPGVACAVTARQPACNFPTHSETPIPGATMAPSQGRRSS